MAPVPEYQTRRTAEYSARNFLRHQGYEVLRVTERHSFHPVLFHLIAWNNREHMLFIRIGSSRIETSDHQEEIRRLTALVCTGRYPGGIQYWIRAGDQFRRYRICAGGSILIPETDDDIC